MLRVMVFLVVKLLFLMQLVRRFFLGVHVRKRAAPVSLLGDKQLPMIVSAIRLSLDDEGNFKGDMGASNNSYLLARDVCCL